MGWAEWREGRNDSSHVLPSAIVESEKIPAYKKGGGVVTQDNQESQENSLYPYVRERSRTELCKTGLGLLKCCWYPEVYSTDHYAGYYCSVSHWHFIYLSLWYTAVYIIVGIWWMMTLAVYWVCFPVEDAGLNVTGFKLCYFMMLLNRWKSMGASLENRLGWAHITK